jgi:hypothetical protein
MLLEVIKVCAALRVATAARLAGIQHENIMCTGPGDSRVRITAVAMAAPRGNMSGPDPAVRELEAIPYPTMLGQGGWEDTYPGMMANVTGPCTIYGNCDARCRRTYYPSGTTDKPSGPSQQLQPATLGPFCANPGSAVNGTASLARIAMGGRVIA